LQGRRRLQVSPREGFRQGGTAKEVKFSVEARDKMLCGIDILADAGG
jgi:hypothetical protein